MPENIGFRLAHPSPGSGGKIPRTVEKPLVSGYAEDQGALLVVNGSDQYAAAGADTALIAAVALTPGGADSSGYNMLANKEFPPGYMQGIAVEGGVQFLAPYVGSLPAAAGGQYGFVRDSDGVYKVDFSDAVNVRVHFHAVPDFRPDVARASEELVLVSFLPAAVQVV